MRIYTHIIMKISIFILFKNLVSDYRHLNDGGLFILQYIGCIQSIVYRIKYITIIIHQR